MTPPPPDRFSSALAAVARALDSISRRSMIIGGVAVIARGVPRFTLDIDATIEISPQRLPDVVARLERQQIVPRIQNALEFAQQHQVLLLVHVPTKIEIDVSLATLSFERDAIDRADTVDFAGVQIRAATPEDLVVYKLIAARPKDLEDAEGLVRRHRATLDSKRITDIIKEVSYALEDSTRLEHLERLLSFRPTIKSPASKKMPPKKARRQTKRSKRK